MFGAAAFWQRFRIAGYALGAVTAVLALTLHGLASTIVAGAYFAIVLVAYSAASIRFLRR